MVKGERIGIVQSQSCSGLTKGQHQEMMHLLMFPNEPKWRHGSVEVNP